MNRISKCFRFRLKNILKSTLWFTVIFYLAACILLSIGTVSFNSGFGLSVAIFAFVYVSADYRTSFNYLLIHGNTRTTIFISNVMANITLSAILTGLTLITSFIEMYILRNIPVNLDEGTTIAQWIYPNADKALEILFMAALFILLTSFSTLYGALTYKFGKYFVTAFWVGLGLMVVTLPMSSSAGGPTVLSVIRSFLWVDHQYGILLAPVSFILAALVFGAATYLLSRRQPQTVPAS